MDVAMVERVRRFNRTVTQRVGALNDSFLSLDRPLGQARVLWEIGADGCDVRRLRSRLELDSGYLSRILRSLEAEGLVAVAPSEADGRVRSVRLTAAGRAELTTLDGRADDLAASVLAPLDPAQQDRLITAMAEVERLLLASAIRIEARDPRHPDAVECLEAYRAELDQRFEGGFDPSRGISATPDQLTPPAGVLLVATLHSGPVGCGAVKFHVDEPAHIKRMWVAPSARGLGLGRRLLGELERQAAAHGARKVHLETNRVLTEAIALYQSAGYESVAPFNDEPHAHHWFAKDLIA